MNEQTDVIVTNLRFRNGNKFEQQYIKFYEKYGLEISLLNKQCFNPLTNEVLVVKGLFKKGSMVSVVTENVETGICRNIAISEAQHLELKK